MDLFVFLGSPSSGGDVWLWGLQPGWRGQGGRGWFSCLLETCADVTGTYKQKFTLLANFLLVNSLLAPLLELWIKSWYTQISITNLSLCLRFCRGSKALVGECGAGKSQIETSGVIFEPRGLSRCFLPLTSTMRRGTTCFEPSLESA